MEELPAKKAAVEDLNSRHKKITLPADKQKDIRIINARWAQVSSYVKTTANSMSTLCKQTHLYYLLYILMTGVKSVYCKQLRVLCA